MMMTMMMMMMMMTIIIIMISIVGSICITTNYCWVPYLGSLL